MSDRRRLPPIPEAAWLRSLSNSRRRARSLRNTVAGTTETLRSTDRPNRAIVNDVRVEMDGERKLTLRARLQELTEEREEVQTLLKMIERALDESRAVE